MDGFVADGLDLPGDLFAGLEPQLDALTGLALEHAGGGVIGGKADLAIGEGGGGEGEDGEEWEEVLFHRLVVGWR